MGKSFNNEVLEESLPEWRYNNIDYDCCRKFLKENAFLETWNSETETKFFTMLEKELQKVNDFGTVKYKELESHLAYVEAMFAKIDDPSISDRKDHLKLECDGVATEITNLDKYHRLNYTGLMKLLERHDKHVNSALRHTFMARMSSSPFYKVSFDPLLGRLSKLYGYLKPSSGEKGKGDWHGVEQRETFWVHPKNLTEVKVLVLQHLPVVVSRSTPAQDSPMETPYSCIYLDTPDHSIYHQVMTQSSALSVRLRWVGSKPSRIHVDTLTRGGESDWNSAGTTTKSFELKQKYVNDFLAGKWSFESKAEKMRAKGWSELQLSELIVESNRVQNLVVQHHLKPCVRSSYQRISFTPAVGATLRVDVDTDIVMVLEQGKTGDNWYRQDVGTGNPPKADNLEPSELSVFPYAELTVTDTATPGTPRAAWLDDLVERNLIRPVPDFKKFAQACTVLLGKKELKLLPLWMPQLENDIRQDDEPLDQPTMNKAAAVAYQPYQDLQPGLHGGSRIKGLVVGGKRGESTNDMDGEASRIRRRKHENIKALADLQKTNSPTEQSKVAEPLPEFANPKVHFANERTFLTWMHTSTIVATIAMALLEIDVKGPSARSAHIAGATLLPLSLVFICYALYLFLWRNDMIVKKHKEPLTSVYGPLCLAGMFSILALVNFFVWFAVNGLNPAGWSTGK